jgi:hypothetical protein
MHILPARLRAKLEDAGLSPSPTDEEKALWAIEEKKVWRRARYMAAGMSTVVLAAATAVKFSRHPDMFSRAPFVTVLQGVLLGGVIFVFFQLQTSGDVRGKRFHFIRARRMHQAILEEPDVELEEQSG